MEQRRDPRRRALFNAALVAVILLIVYVPLRARIERPGRPREAPVAGSSVSIFFTDELAGYREPCG
jgi:hypothetical protein